MHVTRRENCFGRARGSSGELKHFQLHASRADEQTVVEWAANRDAVRFSDNRSGLILTQLAIQRIAGDPQ